MTGPTEPWLAKAWAVFGTAMAPLLRLHLRRRASRGKEIAARLPERWGEDTTPRPAGPLLWLHAASVGETTSLLPVLTALSGVTVLVTTGTVTAAAVLARRLPELGLTDRVLHRFVPLDVPGWAARFLDHWRPDAAGFVESELWPNLLAACRARFIPLMLINARISAGSFAAWRRAPGFARWILSSFALIHARGEEDAARLCALGVAAPLVPGDLKLAAEPLPVDAAELDRLRTRLAGRPIWVAASTHPGEEAEIAAVHRALAPTHPGLLTIIAPRHPERGAELAAALQAPRRGTGAPPPETEGIWIADTLGELGLWYRLAQVAFVGRSLLPPGGGQNPLEPARLGCPIIVGPHTGNFTDAVALLRAAGAITEAADTAALTEAVAAGLADTTGRDKAGKRALAAVQLHADLPQRTADALRHLMRGH